MKKILRYDLPARFKGENPIDLEKLYEIYAGEYGQIIESNRPGILVSPWAGSSDCQRH